MKTLIKTLAVLAVIASSIIACKKNGIGGETTIAAFPAHHGKSIKGATMYVKFDAKDLPENLADFDLKIVGEPKEDHVHIEGLRAGNYYIYAVGYDSIGGYPVFGGTATTIKWSERKKEIDLNVPVTE